MITDRERRVMMFGGPNHGRTTVFAPGTHFGDVHARPAPDFKVHSFGEPSPVPVFPALPEVLVYRLTTVRAPGWRVSFWVLVLSGWQPAEGEAMPGWVEGGRVDAEAVECAACGIGLVRDDKLRRRLAMWRDEATARYWRSIPDQLPQGGAYWIHQRCERGR